MAQQAILSGAWPSSTDTRGELPMSAWDYVKAKYATSPLVDLGEEFTEEECVKLKSIRARFGGHPECAELDLNERRLAFARWLVDHGQLSEGT
jgi:hypothetical protein